MKCKSLLSLLMMAVLFMPTGGAFATAPMQTTAPSGENYVLSSGWIYYFCPDRLLRMREDGTGMERIVDASYMYLCVDGGKLYYPDGFPAAVWRRNIDGTNPERVLDANVFEFKIVGGECFYTTYGTGIYRADLAAPDRTKAQLTPAYAERFIVNDGWIYFFTSIRETAADKKNRISGIVRIRTDGSEQQILMRGKKGDFIELVGVANGRVYYNIGKNVIQGSFRSMNLDGTGKKTIVKHPARCMDEQWAYYVGEKRGLYKVDLDGKRKQTLDKKFSKSSNILYAAGRWLFYGTEHKHTGSGIIEGKAMMISKDGGTKQEVPVLPPREES